MKVAALFVLKNGPYAELTDVDLWDERRDAREYRGPWPVVAHPPCERWGRYWHGGPSVKVRKKLGDDKGCFEAALASVRKYGGVLEHPDEGSHAFKRFGLPLPDFNGGWTEYDLYGGASACVAQGHYGHRARKMTWLYAIRTPLPELTWGPTEREGICEQSFHSKEERARWVKTGICQRLSRRQRLLTPEPFRDLLITMARQVQFSSGMEMEK